MNIEAIFNEVGADALFCTEVMDTLGINADEFIDPKKFNQFKDVVKYLKDSPNWQYVAKKLTTGKMVDKLQHLWEYSQLESQLKMTQEEKQKIRENLETIIKFSGDKKVPLEELDNYKEARKQYEKVESSLADISNEMSIYEK